MNTEKPVSTLPKLNKKDTRSRVNFLKKHLASYEKEYKELSDRQEEIANLVRDINVEVNERSCEHKIGDTLVVSKYSGRRGSSKPTRVMLLGFEGSYYLTVQRVSPKGKLIGNKFRTAAGNIVAPEVAA